MNTTKIRNFIFSLTFVYFFLLSNTVGKLCPNRLRREMCSACIYKREMEDLDKLDDRHYVCLYYTNADDGKNKESISSLSKRKHIQELVIPL